MTLILDSTRLGGMERPLRILLPGGWYHVMNRGHRRSDLFLNDADRQRFLRLLAELPERFGVEFHAFVLMDNHYHVLLRTPEPNLSHAIRWLHVSYSVGFNGAHRQCGAVFAGRFKAVVIQDEKGVAEVARYVHLNPVRVGGLGLGKAEQRRAKVVGAPDPGAALVHRRLEQLQAYRWSSWRVYGAGEPAPAWLETSMVGRTCGGRTRAERRAVLAAYTEGPVRQGKLESPWTRLVGGLVLGEVDYARGLLKGRRVNREEQGEARRMNRRVEWAEVVRAAAAASGRGWSEMVEQYGDWGRDGAMYYAVRHGGQRLAEVVAQMGGLKYQAAAQAVKRFGLALARDAAKRRWLAELKRQLSTI
jgi:putative transposase